jgi:hypothetical protein
MAGVGVAELRRDLKHRVCARRPAARSSVRTGAGPVARISGLDLPLTLHQLMQEGRVSQSRHARPGSRDVDRVKPRAPSPPR